MIDEIELKQRIDEYTKMTSSNLIPVKSLYRMIDKLSKEDGVESK